MTRRPPARPSPLRLALGLAAALSVLFAQGPTRADDAQSATRGPVRPRLVVLVVVDGMGTGYLMRHEPALGQGGFRRLMREGAFFTDARFPYAGTRTAPGHASIVTGAPPVLHGIIGNGWYDRAAGDEVDVEADASTKIVGRPSGAPDAPGVSAHRIVGSTIADELRDATAGRARVLSVSTKPRSAAVLGGKRPSGVYWYDEETGRVVTSSAYRADLPAWVQAINARGEADKRFGSAWERRFAAATYERFGPDDQPGEEAIHGSRTFPRRLTGGLTAPGPDYYEALTQSPYGNELTLELALGALEHEGLGADDVPDLLAISFSGTDNVAHECGPNSHEMLDIFLRLDAQLATLLDALDRRLGDRYALVLTSDHGMMPLPEVSRAAGQRASRIHPDAVVTAVETRLDAELGVGDWVTYMDDENLYLDRALLAEKGADYARACRLAADAIAGVEGVAVVLTAPDAPAAALSADARVTALAAGFSPGRSGDVLFVTEPFWVVRDEPDGTAHGAPYAYDTQVPIIAYRCGLRAGAWRRTVSPLDVAPTLAGLLGTGIPSQCRGRALAAE